jgi:pyridoxine 5-phosphate synthase
VIGLGVNIDHVATIRQARRAREPDPVWAAVEAQLGGADAITVHLREDRRHIQDHDLERLGGIVQVRLNLEMAATDAMISIAADRRPHMATLVPEGRAEITTEGGLDVAGQRRRLQDAVARLRGAGIRTSAFIDPEPRQVEAAAACGFEAAEIHTGRYATVFERLRRAEDPEIESQLQQVRDAGRLILEAGMQLNAGHGLNYVNVGPIASLPGVAELHIGHAIVSRAVFVGLRQAVAEMKRLMCEAAPGRLASDDVAGADRPAIGRRRVRQGAAEAGGLS